MSMDGLYPIYQLIFGKHWVSVSTILKNILTRIKDKNYDTNNFNYEIEISDISKKC